MTPDEEMRRYRLEEKIAVALSLVIGLGGGTLLLNAMFGFFN